MNQQYMQDDSHILPSSFYASFKTESDWLIAKREEVKARFHDKLIINNPHLKLNLRAPTVLV